MKNSAGIMGSGQASGEQQIWGLLPYFREMYCLGLGITQMTSALFLQPTAWRSWGDFTLKTSCPSSVNMQLWVTMEVKTTVETK